VKVPQKILYTGGVAAPVDLTGQMTAAIVSSTMLLQQRGWLANAEVEENMKVARALYNVTMSVKGVLEHNRQYWRSESFYDDRLWAVRPAGATFAAALSAFLTAFQRRLLQL
jgi:hypothetical protein